MASHSSAQSSRGPSQNRPTIEEASETDSDVESFMQQSMHATTTIDKTAGHNLHCRASSSPPFSGPAGFLIPQEGWQRSPRPWAASWTTGERRWTQTLQRAQRDFHYTGQREPVSSLYTRLLLRVMSRHRWRQTPPPTATGDKMDDSHTSLMQRVFRLHQHQHQDATRIANEAMGAALEPQDQVPMTESSNILFFPDDQCRDNEWFQWPPIFLSHNSVF